MGLFKSNDSTNTCKLCNQDFSNDYFNQEFGICNGCLLLSGVHIDNLKKFIPELQEKANSAFSPSQKITYLSLMLEHLYKYKILYADNDVHLIDGDIDSMIDEVIDCISEAKL